MIPAISGAMEDPSPAGGGASVEQHHATQPDTSKHVRQAVGMQRGAEENPASSSAKSSHTTSSIIPDPPAARCRDGDSASAGAGARRCDGGQCVV